MKKFLRVLCSLIFVFMVGAGCGCKGCSSNIYPTSIKEWTLEKDTYELGEYLDLTGSTILVEYSNGESYSKEVTYDMVSVFDLVNVYGSTGVHSLKVAYEENGHKVTADKQITVKVQKARLDAITEIQDYKKASASLYSEDAQSRIDALKALSRSAIYAANSDEEVVEIKNKAKAAIDTVSTKAEQELVDDIAKTIKTELLSKVAEVEGSVSELEATITTALTNYVSQEAADALKKSITADYKAAIAEAVAGIQGGAGEPGQDGKSVELRNYHGYIQWRQEGSNSNWSNLFNLADYTGPVGPAGQDGNDGNDGVSVDSVALTDDGKLKFTFSNNEETTIDLSSVLKPNAELAAKLDKLEKALADELDAEKEDSLQYQIDKLSKDLDDLKQELNGLSISDTFDNLQSQINDIQQYFINSGLTSVDDISSASLLQMLTSLASEKIEELSLQYYGRVITLDELKDKLINEIIPYAVASYRAAKEAKVRVQKVYDILSDNTLDAKAQLKAVLEVLAEYDDVLLAIGVPAEKVEALSAKLHAFKDKLLNYVKNTVNAYIDKLNGQLVAVYDLNKLLEANAGNATLLTYQAEITNTLNALGYKGDEEYYDVIDQLHALVDNLTYSNAFATLGEAVTLAMSFIQIDSLNQVLPAMLATLIQEYYDSYVKPMADYLSTADNVKISKAMNTYKYAILRTNSAVNAIDYASKAKEAILGALLSTTFGAQVNAIKEAIDAEDAVAAKNALLDLDADIVASLMSGIYGATVLGQITQQFYSLYTARFTVMYYFEYKAAYPAMNEDTLFDDYIQPAVAMEVNAIMADADTVTAIEFQVIGTIRPLVTGLVDSMFNDLYGVASIHDLLSGKFRPARMV